MGKTRKTTPPTLTIEAREANGWLALSQCFAYTHPANGRVYKVNIDGKGATEEAARADCQAKIDYFLADRGDSILKVGNFVWKSGDDDGLGDVQAHDEPGRPAA